MIALTEIAPTLLPGRRKQLEDAVERALAALDALDGDPDFEEQCEDEGAFDGDNDTSDYEASLCGVRFGCGSPSALDAEGTGPAFLMDQRSPEAVR